MHARGRPCFYRLHSDLISWASLRITHRSLRRTRHGLAAHRRGVKARDAAAYSMRRITIPFFRIWYSGTFTSLFIILLCLLAVTPADHIYQTLSNDKLGNVFVVGATYFVTGVVALFIYASRLYTNRAVLAAIPKSYLPIEVDDVAKKVRRAIVKNRVRSAIVAWDSRPRDLRPEIKRRDELYRQGSTPAVEAQQKEIGKCTVIPVLPEQPPWGMIIHPGWSSPATDDFPDLQFEVVIAELPNLIEAKAVSLAPSDPTYHFFADLQDMGPMPPDPRAVALLQRGAAMGLRQYLNHLQELEVIDPPELASSFLVSYEYARFSTDSLTDLEFRQLMALFSDLLIGISKFDPKMLKYADAASTWSESSLTGSVVRPSGSYRPGNSPSQRSRSSASMRSTDSVIRHGPAGMG
ncbi:hypothetical protein MRB53_039723 [Persea americana]|nr:hypothetical protein MRB53_039723 [Persea americana]